MPRSFDICRPIRRFYKPILLLALVATAAGGYLTSRLSLESDLAELLPDDFQSVQAVEELREEVGGTGQLRVALATGDFEAATELADTLASRLARSEYVSSVDYRNDVEFYRRHALLFLDTASLDTLQRVVERTLESERQRANPFVVDDLFGPAEGEEAEGGDEEDAGSALAEWEEEYEGRVPRRYYTDEDSTVLVMSLNPSQASTDLSFSQAMLEDVRRIVEEVGPQQYAPDMEVHYGSNIKNAIDEYRAVRDDIFGTAAYGIGGVFLLLVLIFRRFVVAVLLSASLASALSWTFGITYLLVGQLNTITGFLFVVLFGMGIDYGIHAMARYVESRQAGANRDEALHHMVCRTGRALGTTAYTTSAAFLVLMLLDFRGFSELGLITGIGMLLTFAAMVVLLPALVIVAGRLGLLRIEPVEGKEMSAGRRPFRFARGILVGAGAVTLVCGYLFATRVEFQYDFTDLRYLTEERERFGEVTEGVFTRSESPAVVLADSREEVAAIVEAVRERMRADTASPTIESVSSIFDLLPSNQEARLQRIRATRELVNEDVENLARGEDRRRIERLREMLQVDESVGWEDFPENDRRRFADRRGDPGNFVLIYPSVALRDGRNAIEFRNDVGTIVTDSGEEFHAASSNIIVADMLLMITREGPLAVALALGMVFLIVLADFRSLRAAIFVVSPLLLAVIWMGGAMYAVGMRLNFFNIVVFPSVVGIGVDAAVHIYHRYREEGAGSLHFVLRRTGAAVGLATLTTIVGYSGLIMASHPGLQSMGELAVIGLFLAFVAAVVVLPAMLELFGEGRGGEEPAPVPVQHAPGRGERAPPPGPSTAPAARREASS